MKNTLNFNQKTLLKERKHLGSGYKNKYQRKRLLVETVQGWMFVSPLLVVALLFVSLGIVIALIFTLFSGTRIENLKFVGLGNWKLLFFDPVMIIAIKNTFFYAMVTSSITLISSLLLSTVLNLSKIKGKKTWISLFFFPSLTSSIAVIIIFKTLVSKDGIIPLDWEANPNNAIWILIFASIWGGTFGIVTWNTAFQSIDNSQYESAELDGAGRIKKTLFITLPSLSPIIAYSLMMSLIGGLGIFSGPYIMAKMADGSSASSLYTIAYFGFSWILPINGSLINIGFGTCILFFLGLLMLSMSLLSNIIMPINKRSY